MFSRLFTMLLFTWTVYMAAFGQHIFGREHIIEMANNFGPTVAEKSEVLSQETTRFFADIAPSAGEEAKNDQTDDFIFTFVLVDSLTPQESISFLNEKLEQAVEKDEQPS